jgi:signal transduction histidine kinase
MDKDAQGETVDQLWNGAPCGLLSCASDGTIMAVNDTFLSWTGYERQALVGLRHFDELLTVPCRIYHETHISPLLHIQGSVSEMALDIRSKDCSIIASLVNTAAERRPDGSIARISHAVFSAGDRRAYERELLIERRNCEQAVKAKADFLAMFAHEIRNPLGAVLLEAELLERCGARAHDDPVVIQLRESLDRVLNLLNNMLDISRHEAGKSTLQKAEFEIRDVVQAVVHSLRPLAVARHLALSVRIGDSLPRRVIGDPIKLDQALTNLVTNAIKFTEAGSVMIGAELSAQFGESVRVRFRVEDTGIGISAERHARIFDAYEQADASIRGRCGGAGLGLAITRKLIELQGGKLEVVSEPGRGSIFSFELTFDAA